MFKLLIISFAIIANSTPSESFERGDNFLLTFKHCGKYTNVVFSDSGYLVTQAIDLDKIDNQIRAKEFIAEFSPENITKIIIPCES